MIKCDRDYKKLNGNIHLLHVYVIVNLQFNSVNGSPKTRNNIPLTVFVTFIPLRWLDVWLGLYRMAEGAKKSTVFTSSNNHLLDNNNALFRAGAYQKMGIENLAWYLRWLRNVNVHPSHKYPHNKTQRHLLPRSPIYGNAISWVNPLIRIQSEVPIDPAREPKTVPPCYSAKF